MGSTYPRTTAILQSVGLSPDFSGVPAVALEVARIRGTAVHAAIENHHYLGDPGELPPGTEPFFNAYLSFLDDTKHEPVCSEFEVVSERWGYCGHPDRLGWLVKQRCLIDYKTGSFDPLYTARQLCLYRLAWDEMHPDQPVKLTVGLQLKQDGSYRVHELDSRAEEQVALAALVIYKAKGREA